MNIRDAISFAMESSGVKRVRMAEALGITKQGVTDTLNRDRDVSVGKAERMLDVAGWHMLVKPENASSRPIVIDSENGPNIRAAIVLAMERAGVSRAEMARRTGVSQAAVTLDLDCDVSTGTATALSMLEAVSWQLCIAPNDGSRGPIVISKD